MFKDGKWLRVYQWDGVVHEEEHTEHAYAWTGRMPCTGQRKCILCGKPEEVNV